jgi:hypothetical protein
LEELHDLGERAEKLGIQREGLHKEIDAIRG